MKCGNVPLADKFLSRLFNHAWTIFRNSATRADQIVQAAVCWRNQAWWEEMQLIGEVSTDTWRHAHRGKRPMQWEDVFVHSFGFKWHEKLAGADTLSKATLRSMFVDQSYGFANAGVPKRVCKPEVPKPIDLHDRVVELGSHPNYDEWSEYSGFPRIQILGDSRVTCGWFNARFSFSDIVR